MFKCPNCGGSLYFDIDQQRMKCRHCSSEINVEDYSKDNRADMNDMSVYTCSRCGAQLISPDQSAVAFCTYCGAEQILEDKYHGIFSPKKIIPFKVSKKDCVEKYKEQIGSFMYAPKEFSDAAFLEKFRGIYIPYWQIETGFQKQNLEMTGTADYRKGDYAYNETYKLTAELGNTVKSLPFDASSNFDDTIAEGIAPYRQKSVRKYHPGYLAGFYADTADVPADKYCKEAEEHAVNSAEKAVEKAFYKKGKIKPDIPYGIEEKKEFFKPEIRSFQSLLLPVWFLTWRKKNRVAYMVVNGETGEVSAEMPVSYLSFFGFSALTAVLLFILLTMTVSVTAPTALLICMTLSAAVMMIYQKQAKLIHDKETHVFDKGYFIEGRETKITEKKAEKIRRRRELDLWSIASVFVVIILFIAEILVYRYSRGMPDEKAARAAVYILPVMGYNLFRTITFAKNIGSFSVIPEILTAAAGILFGYYVLFTLQVYDWMYYSACILCILGTLITTTGLIRKYNLLATRPLPSFFDRTGGDDSGRQ